MSLSVNFFLFILPGIHWASWMYGCLCPDHIWKVYGYNFFEDSSCPFLSPSGTFIMFILLELDSASLWDHVHLSSFLFLFCFMGWIISVDLLQVHWFLFLPVQICCPAPLINFSLQLFYISTPEFVFGSLKKNSLNFSIDILYLVRYHSDNLLH